MAIFGSLSTVRTQTAPLTWLQPAFVYLEELFKSGTAAHQKLSSLAPGETHRRDLIGGIFALEQAYRTRGRTEAAYETHRKYIDIQVIFEGEELMEVIDRAGLTVRDPYDPARDVMFYHDVAHGSVLRLRTGGTAVYFPDDAHKGGLQIGPQTLVRKAVIKVPVPV